MSYDNLGTRRGKQLTLRTLWSWDTGAAAESLQSCPTLRLHTWQPTRLRRPWDSPGKNTGVGYLKPCKNSRYARLKQQAQGLQQVGCCMFVEHKGEMTDKISEAGRGTLALSEQMYRTSFRG